ncbi:hypothetical protein B0H19DRAFT_1219728 [Mycena capillaripes]|nr:hypothetical protein B0H19DRAFT_1219728 [Mycena capillaripes]
MSAPITIAILGASGTLGPFLLQAIAAHPKAQEVRLRILTRPTSTEKAHTLAAQYLTLYLTVHPIDYTAAETGLDAALRGVDVVISAVGDDSRLRFPDVVHTGFLPGSLAQDAVARAAKAAGVRLFVPSEYGAPTHSIPLDSESFVVGKRHHHELLRQLQLPYVLIYAGKFTPTDPALTPLPPCIAEAPIPLSDPPFETARCHVAAYIIQLILDRGVEAVAGVST